MARIHSYGITHINNATEKEAIEYLIDNDSSFINPDKESRKAIMELMGIPNNFSRAFDLLKISGKSNLDEDLTISNPKDVTLIELKTTKKKLVNNPRGFFFGATENEFDLAKQFEDQFLFCFVSLHPESRSYSLLTLMELESLIRTKRTQYQINLVP